MVHVQRLFLRGLPAHHTLMNALAGGRTTVDGGIDIRIDAAVDIAFASQGRAILKIIPAASETQHIRLENIAIAGAPYRVELLGEDRVVVIDADTPGDLTIPTTGPLRPTGFGIATRHSGRALHTPDARPVADPQPLLPFGPPGADGGGSLSRPLDPGLLERCRDWVHGNVTYVSGSSDAMTSADETLLAREGICRDFAHLMISFLRGLGVPARFVAAFGPGVDPPDFHAVVEAHDGERRQLLDLTRMTAPTELVVIARGRDAGDVPWRQIQSGPAVVAPPQVRVSIEHTGR